MNKFTTTLVSGGGVVKVTTFAFYSNSWDTQSAINRHALNHRCRYRRHCRDPARNSDWPFSDGGLVWRERDEGT